MISMLSAVIALILSLFVYGISSYVVRTNSKARQIEESAELVYSERDVHYRVHGTDFTHGMVFNKKTKKIEPQSKASTNAIRKKEA